MKEDIDIAYRELVQVFSSQSEEAGDKLIEFTAAYSQNDELHFRSQLLKDDVIGYAGDPVVRKEIIDQMSQMAEEVYRQALSDNKSVPANIDISAIFNEWSEKPWERKVVYHCEGISKCYAGSDFCLRDIHLTLREGEITGVVGENGNGKTTLLKIIAGELFPEKNTGHYSYGSLQGEDRAPDWVRIKSNIAYLPQELERLIGSVKKSVQYSAALHGIKGEENDKEVKYIIQRLGLGKYENATWQELSGGYKLRFALAMILVWKPRLIVLDEPLANLDINTQIRVLNDLKDLCRSIKNPIAIVMSSQNIEEVETASDNMIVLKEGAIIYQNATKKIGEERKENVFEFRCNYERAELERCLRGLDHTGLDHNGSNYFITVPLSVSELSFLKYCAEKNVALTYFQDISISTKRFIVKTYLTDNL
jgi:ABC-2 type transport system ATP-binding protein